LGRFHSQLAQQVQLEPQELAGRLGREVQVGQPRAQVGPVESPVQQQLVPEAPGE